MTKSARTRTAVEPLAAPANITGARAYVDVGTAQPRKRSVLDAANVISVTDPHVLLGAEYESILCGDVGTITTNCGTPANKTPSPIVNVTGDPFALYNLIECAPFGHTPDEMLTMAETGLAYKEPVGVEAQVGLLLTTAAASAGTPTTNAGAVGLLDQWLLDNWNGQGLILASGTAASVMLGAHALTYENGVLYTAGGTEVVVGAFGANNVAYAVGRLTLLKGPVFSAMVPMNLSTGNPTNLTRALAERSWVPLIECTPGKVTLT